jgi:hypothetical protein
MDPDRRRSLLKVVTFLAQPSPDFEEYQRYIVNTILLLSRLPPDPPLDIKSRLVVDHDAQYSGRNVFGLFSRQRFQFFEITGESPETFVDLVNVLNIPETNNNLLSRRNRVLLVLIWLRSYPTYNFLSVLFNISTSTVKEQIWNMVSFLDTALEQYLQWPTVDEWSNLRGNWNKIPVAVGAIDGTSHEIYRPKEDQEQFYSGYRSFHCIHTQIVIDNTGQIRHVESGFLGHQNDAQQFMLMQQIGGQLPFPDNCVLLGDKIYPNRHPVMTPFSAPQLRRKVGDDRRRAYRLNRYISRYRINVEHAIAEMKTYQSISTVWRHPRYRLSQIVRIVAKLVCRRKDIGLIL